MDRCEEAYQISGRCKGVCNYGHILYRLYFCVLSESHHGKRNMGAYYGRDYGAYEFKDVAIPLGFC